MSGHDTPLVLGVDLGGTKILTAVVDAQGELLSRDHSVTPAAKGPEAVIQAIIESAGRAITQAGMDASDLIAVGIGAPGLSNPETGILFTSPNLPGWRDVPLRDVIEKKLGRLRTIKNGPRTIDIDILLYDNQTVTTDELTLPHPRMLERNFVMKPLAEIEPGLAQKLQKAAP